MSAARAAAIAVAAAFALAVAAAALANGYWVFVIASAAITAIAGIGLNVLIGLTGQVSFGHVGFYAIGAYAVAIVTTRFGWPLAIALPLAALLAALTGLALAVPALRVRGPYLAMVTIAFGFIVENVAVEWRSVTGGQNGLMGIPTLSIGARPLGERGIAILAIALAAVSLYGYRRLARGPWGEAMRAVRDSETAAASIGIDAVAVKSVAFAVSAALAGLAGGLSAPLAGFIAPSTFGFSISILFVLVVVIGGAGSALGPLLGAAIVVLLPEMLSGLAEYRLLLFGGLLLLMLWVAPNGVAGLLSRRARPERVDTPAQDSPPLPLPTRVRRALEARGITRHFGGVRAVTAVSLTVHPGVVHAIIGPNGAGKSTALNVLSGFYAPQEGETLLGAERLRPGSAVGAARAGVARTYQTTQLFGSLDVERNVTLAQARGRLASGPGERLFVDAGTRARTHALLDFVGYAGARNVTASSLPHVDRRLVEIARALALDPDVLLLDEPAAGLSQEDKTRLGALLRRIAAHGIGVALVEHDMALVMGFSDEVTVLESGERIAHGAPDAVQADPRVRHAYLGAAAQMRDAPRAPREAGASLLEVGRLEAGYGAAPVLKGIELRVRDGEMVAVLGPNGAGKSTLLRSLAGLHRPVTGGISLDGADCTRLAAHQLAARGVVLVPEGRQVFPELSVHDNLRLGAYRHPRTARVAIEEMLQRFPQLRERLGQRAGLLSGGEQQMLAIARGLLGRPRLLLLDEPSLGLAPQRIEELFASLERLRDERMTVLLVDQMAALALAVCDRACVLDDGRVRATGDASNLDRAYLGDTSGGAGRIVRDIVPG